jgi:hypothetical protein
LRRGYMEDMKIKRSLRKHSIKAHDDIEANITI